MPDLSFNKILMGSALPKTEDPIVTKLRQRHPEVQAKLHHWDQIDDVMEHDLHRRFEMVDAVMSRNEVETDKKGNTSVRQVHFKQKMKEFKHLPKDLVEPWSEYERRVENTPFFPETPGIVETRTGALFAKTPAIEVHEDVAPWLPRIGPRRQSYLDILRFIAQRSYSHGFLAVFVDFRQIPMDVRIRMAADMPISEAEVAERGLNEPVLGVFNERQVMDFSHSEIDGRLNWIKLREIRLERESAFDEPMVVETYRIIDRFNVVLYEVRQVKGQAKVTDIDVVSHGALDEEGQPEVPVVLIAPLSGNNEVVGESGVGLSVIADLAATRILSSLLWYLHLHGHPQLVLTTMHQGKTSRHATLQTGASRFLELFIDPATQVQETLEYLQLEAEGITLLEEQYQKMASRVSELANRTPPRSTNQPVPMSGVAKAWDFKTGEEKSVQHHRLVLETGSNEILRLLSRRLHDAGRTTVDKDELSDSVRTSFDPSFVIGDPKLNIEVAESIRAVGEKKKMPSVVVAAVRRVVTSLVNLSDKEQQAIEEDLTTLGASEEAKTTTPEPKPEPEGEGEEEETPEGDESEVNKEVEASREVANAI